MKRIQSCRLPPITTPHVKTITCPSERGRSNSIVRDAEAFARIIRGGIRYLSGRRRRGTGSNATQGPRLRHGRGGWDPRLLRPTRHRIVRVSPDVAELRRRGGEACAGFPASSRNGTRASSASPTRRHGTRCRDSPATGMAPGGRPAATKRRVRSMQATLRARRRCGHGSVPTKELSKIKVHL